MKKIIRWGTLAALCLLLTGCIDIFHTVSLHKGRADVTVRYTMQKAMLDALSSFSGEEMDYSDFSDMSEEIFSEFEGVDAEVQPINTSYHFGAKIRIRGAVKDLAAELDDTMFLPIQRDDSYVISLPSLRDEGDELDEASLAFMGGTTYTLLVDLTGDLRNIRRAGLDVDEQYISREQAEDIGVEIYGASMLVEIPMILFFLVPDKIDVVLSQAPESADR